MYLIDTNVISEARKRAKANRGVIEFFEAIDASSEPVFLPAVSVGELRRGVELIRHRGDHAQAELLETWMANVVESFGQRILNFDADVAQVWGHLRVPDPGHSIDKQIAAIALVNDLTLVTRNITDFEGLGVKLANPFR